MAEDDEIICTPVMRIVPGLVIVPDGALDTCGDMQGLVVGWEPLPNGDRAIFFGARQKDGAAMIVGIPSVHWPRLLEVIDKTFVAAGNPNVSGETRQ